MAQLKVRLSASEKAAIESRPASDIEAYDLYLQARDLFLKSQYQQSITLLNQALRRDSHFVEAYCLLSSVHLYAYRFGDDRSEEHLSKAKEAVDTAVQLAPNLSEVHLAKAQYYYNGLRDYEKTLSELSAAPPSSGNRARFFDLSALAERRLGNWKAALSDGEKALALDPHDPFVSTEVIQTYMYLRKYSQAEALSRRAAQLSPALAAGYRSMELDSILAKGEPERAKAVLDAATAEADDLHPAAAKIALYLRDYPKAMEEIKLGRKAAPSSTDLTLDLMAGATTRAQGDAEKSKALFEKTLSDLESRAAKHPDDAATLSRLALAYAGCGRKDDALRVSRDYVRLIPSWRDAAEGPSYAALQAQVEAWVGEKEAAIAQLSGLVRHAGGISYGELKYDPGWDDLRGDPRFEAIIAEAAKPIEVR